MSSKRSYSHLPVFKLKRSGISPNNNILSKALQAQPVPSLKLKSQSDFDTYMSVGEETKGEVVRVKQPSQHPSLLQLDLSN